MRTPIGMHRRKYPTESVSYNIVADEEGNIYLPVGGYNRSSSSRNATYDWMVSIDDGTPVNYSGTGSAGGSITFSGYQVGSEHSITITPVAKAYGWALAYGWYETAGAPYLTKVNYDLSYMGYGSSATSTGNYFRCRQYRGCTSLVFAPDEVLPNGVTSFGNYFRYGQYRGCSSLVNAPDEVLPNGITSIGGYFRYYQYYGCTSLISAPDEVIPNTVTSIGASFRYYQYYQCTSLVSAPDEVLPNTVTSIGNSFRREQYRGCTSLVNAPDEVLPNTVTSIGDYFRYCQYLGCTLLVSAPDEVLPNSVTSIGSNFRREQYRGCTSLTSAKLIANNAATTTSKRYMQFSYAGNTTNPMVITIYGNEMEADMATNSCGLANANVSFIYVQPNLVEQYQQAAIRSNIDDVKFGPIEEIIYKMNADDNGNLYVPVGGHSGFSPSYNWNVSVDGGNTTNYSGTGSSGGSITLSGYTPGTNHTIKITPTNVAYQWARAYGWYNTVGAPYLTEVFYDGSYMGYGSNATSTGDFFRRYQYRGCTSLVNAPDEVLPSTVTSIGDEFRNGQYYGCTSLVSAPDEVLPNSITDAKRGFRWSQYQGCSSLVNAPDEVLPNTVTSIGNNFRYYQYYGCSSLVNAPAETLPSSVTSIGTSFRGYQYYGCSSLVNAPDEVFPSSITSINNSFRYRQYRGCTSLVTAPDEVLPSSVTSIGDGFRGTQYNGCTSLVNAPDEVLPNSVTSIGTNFRGQQYQDCTSLTSAKLIANNAAATSMKRYYQFYNAGNTTTPMTITISGSEVELDMAANSCGLGDTKVATIYVPSALVQGYKDAAIWSNITDSKFVGY